MKLTTICNIKTLLTDSEDGPIAAFILPSSSQDKHSPHYCHVNTRNGFLKLHTYTRNIMPSTVLEMDWAAYRYGAIANLNLKHQLSCNGKLEECIVAWLEAIPANNAKLFFGGGMVASNDIELIARATAKVSNKNIYLQITGNQRLIPVLKRCCAQENLIIGVIKPSNADLYLTDCPFSEVYYSATSGKHDELYHMPKKADKLVVWNIDPRCLEAFETKKPLLDTLLS
jgi:hypothetical protein